jgi:hypothetical protein
MSRRRANQVVAVSAFLIFKEIIDKMPTKHYTESTLRKHLRILKGILRGETGAKASWRQDVKGPLLLFCEKEVDFSCSFNTICP